MQDNHTLYNDQARRPLVAQLEAKEGERKADQPDQNAADVDMITTEECD